MLKREAGSLKGRASSEWRGTKVFSCQAAAEKIQSEAKNRTPLSEKQREEEDPGKLLPGEGVQTVYGT